MDEGLFCPCQKDFTTPLGVAANDAATSAALAKAAGDALSLDDFVHRDEHSIEFQLIFLQRILGAESFSLVPVLCGNLMHGLPEYTRAAYQEAAGGFLAGLRELAADPQTLLVAGVDLCHVGPKFGHQAQASELLHEAGAHDRALLAAVAKGDADALWAESARVRDRYHVCGFSALAALLEVLGPGQNQILSYQMMQEEPTQSVGGSARECCIRRRAGYPGGLLRAPGLGKPGRAGNESRLSPGARSPSWLGAREKARLSGRGWKSGKWLHCEEQPGGMRRESLPLRPCHCEGEPSGSDAAIPASRQAPATAEIAPPPMGLLANAGNLARRLPGRDSGKKRGAGWRSVTRRFPYTWKPLAVSWLLMNPSTSPAG